MPKRLHQNKILKEAARPIFFILFSLFFIFLLSSSRATQANPGACQLHTISGWAWSSNAGWVSLSCKNTVLTPEDYGLDINLLTRTISGWAWSSTGPYDCSGPSCTGFGWICFGTTCANYCSTSGECTSPPSGSAIATYNENTGEVSGWANVISLGDDGWLKLRGQTTGGQTYGLVLNPNRTISGFAWNGYTITGESQPRVGIGWLSFTPVLNIPNAQCSDGIDNDSDEKIDLADECCSRPTDNTEDDFCRAAITLPWVKALYKDIYSQGEIASDFLPPLGEYNATYMILADNTIRNWVSAGSIEQPETLPADWVKESGGFSFSFPQESGGVYISNLGSIDYEGLRTKVSGDKNKYGQTVGNFSDFDQSAPQFTKDIYYSETAAAFSQEMVFSNTLGARLFLINGDFTIQATTSITASPLSNISELTSLAFIIKGDLIISPTVGRTVGAFIVLGNGSSCPVDLAIPSNGCGRVITGTTGDQSTEERLVIEGLVMARQFKFERSYIDELGQSAEEVLFDVRLLVNPPPGMVDLSKGLPLFRTVAP